MTMTTHGGLLGPIWDCRPDRAPDFLIGPPGDPYMERWFLIPRNKQFNVYYHRILHDDDDRALHDHPWPSLSVVTAGRLREVTEAGARELARGDVVFRTGEFAHRLELVGGKPAETLFITGPNYRDWGFLCPQGWRRWDLFVDPANPGEPGAGCGEQA